MISSSLPFPPISWWQQACAAQQVTFDLAEHYQKMSYRNRYYLAAPSGRMLLSLPLEKGRNQRMPVGEVQLSYCTSWQDNHWKTIVSLYGRSPFFEYFAPQLEPLFRQHFPLLHTFNKAGILLVAQLLKLPLALGETTQFVAHYPEGTCDLRHSLSPQQPVALPAYHQVFTDRTGFLTDCSILDLLFCEGPYAAALLQTV
ncbi:WbqC family protein [Taibaiella koreensis]|uniref:WbqC family protein n=1 Tax=Taibaiella koreensis TaxID=1268548 RepID=UPI000E59E869|nr:WbqC family protein [Taibaiella koreensis]